MSTQDEYIAINRALWDERTRHHINSGFYDVAGFKEGKSSLNDIELKLLGDIKDKSLLHLQCHFGQDTLSLARMGAHTTGIDLSETAISTATQLARDLELDARFIATDLYSLPEALNEQFDIVFTSYGVIGWLPDMQRWAKVVRNHLKPGGVFVLVEFHPVMWMLDNDFTRIEYSYFNKDVFIENEAGTYADRDAPMQLTSVSWNHSLSEVMQALLNEGLQIELFEEYDYSPYKLTNMAEVQPGRFQINGLEAKLPLVYAIKATLV